MTTEITKKEPSKKLREAILNVVGSFQKTVVLIDQAFAIGRAEGFSDMEIGSMIRKEMLAAGYDRRTIRRALPPTSKHTQKTRKDYSDEDILSSSEHENEDRTQPAQKSDNNMSLETTHIVRDGEFVPKVPGLPTIERQQESVLQKSVTKQKFKQSMAERLQPTVNWRTKEDNIKSGSARISISSENNELLKFEFSIPKDDVWQYISDHYLDDDDQFWINGVMNKRTGKIISRATGRSRVFMPVA